MDCTAVNISNVRNPLRWHTVWPINSTCFIFYSPKGFIANTIPTVSLIEPNDCTVLYTVQYTLNKCSTYTYSLFQSKNSSF